MVCKCTCRPCSWRDDPSVCCAHHDAQWDVAEAARRLTSALQWRAENDIDAVRNKIVEGNITQYDFPHRDELLPYIPHNSDHGLDKVR